MPPTEESLKADIRIITRIPFLPALLDIVCAATGMGFAAVARVTEERWIAGAVLDKIAFGLSPGGELPVASTICHEIRECREPVIIDHVSHDAHYRNHHTPATYGFESYISFPIIGADGLVFGTVCAIDPKAAQLNTPPIIDLFTCFASLIANYLDGLKGLSAANLAKIEMYTTAELNNARRDLEAAADADDEARIQTGVRQLALKLNQLLFAFEPGGAFLS